MDFKVVITERATEDLREIVEHIARDNPRAAARMGQALLDAALSLGVFTHRGAMHDAARVVRKLTRQPYKIFYRVKEAHEVVDILHFWHAARSEPNF
jgi:plasmid stabilization system protein ParE